MCVLFINIYMNPFKETEVDHQCPGDLKNGDFLYGLWLAVDLCSLIKCYLPGDLPFNTGRTSVCKRFVGRCLVSDSYHPFFFPPSFVDLP